MTCKANVDMVLTPDITKDPVKWTTEKCITKLKGGYGSYPVLSVGKDQAPTDHHLVYLIENPAGSTWKFAKDSNALWVNSSGQDPKQPSIDSHVPVPSIHTSNPNPPNPATTDTQLSFTDHNGQTAATLNYTLNFVNGQKSSSTLDPIIDNGGCCTYASFFSSPIQITGGEFTIYLLFAVIAGAIAA